MINISFDGGSWEGFMRMPVASREGLYIGIRAPRHVESSWHPGVCLEDHPS